MRWLLLLLLVTPAGAQDDVITEAGLQVLLERYKEVYDDNVELADKVLILRKRVQELQAAKNCV